MVKEINRTKLGIAAEKYFQSECLRRGIGCYEPASSDSRIDLIIEPESSKFYTCQIKTCRSKLRGTKTIPLRKCSANTSGLKKYYYTEKDFDFIIGIDMDSGDIYLVPMLWLKDHGYKRSISCGVLDQYGFKNHFDIFKSDYARRI